MLNFGEGNPNVIIGDKMARKNTAEKLDKQEVSNVVELERGMEENEKIKKKGHRGLVVIITLLIIIAALIFVIFKFNVFGMRDGFFSFLHSLDPDYVAVEQLEVQLNDKELELQERETKLAHDEAALAKQAEELTKKETQLSSTERETEPIYRGLISEQDLEDMKSLSKIFSSMSAESAASILSSLYTVEDMTAIIYFMSESSAASIMQVLDVELAAEITNALLHT